MSNFNRIVKKKGLQNFYSIKIVYKYSIKIAIL